MSSTDEYIGTVAQDVCTTFIIYKIHLFEQTTLELSADDGQDISKYFNTA